MFAQVSWERHRSSDAAAAITASIRQFFADTPIPAESYRGLVAEVDGPDPDANAHLAAAVAGQVELLVTWNGKDFECGFSRKPAIKIGDPIGGAVGRPGIPILRREVMPWMVL